MAFLPDRYVKFGTEVGNMTSFKVVVAYLVLVAASPAFRRLTTPLSLKSVMFVHNMACVVLSSASLMILCYGIFDSKSIFNMEPNPVVKIGLFVYLVSKYVELLDTVFMILRHKQRQISFLHVYHHSTILILGDYSYKFAQWPPVAVMIALNSLVHVFLYAYYAKSAISSGVDKIWKKRLTQLQLLQFFLGLALCTKGYLYHGFCIYGIFYGASMVILFSNFYYWAYFAASRHIKKE